MSQLPECDYCENTEDLKKIDDSLVCPTCIARGIHEANENQKKAGQAMSALDAPISINEVLKTSREIDNRATVKTDIFNAETVAIADLKKAIDADPAIENKPYAIGLIVKERYESFRKLIFSLQEQVVEATNKQRADQIYLNQLANTLRAEEREKLKIQDINYKPAAVKTPITPKTLKMSKKKVSNKDVRDACIKGAINGVPLPEFAVRMVLTAKQISLDDAVKQVRDNLLAAQTKSTPTTEAPAQS